MTATSKRLLTTTGLLALLWAPTTSARTPGDDPPAGMQVRLLKAGAPMAAKAMVLYNGSKPKGADLTANVGTFKEEDVEDRRRGGTLLLDEFADGSASLQIVLDGVTVPTPLPGGVRRDLGGITVRRGASFVVDAGTGTVTDTTEQTTTTAPAATTSTRTTMGSATATTTTPSSTAASSFVPKPGANLFSRYYIGVAGGLGSMVPTKTFCDDNSERLGQVAATQDACDNNSSGGVYGVSAGLTVARIGAWDLLGAGGYGRFGQTQPQGDGSARTFTITRRVRQDFTGAWVGAGFQRNWPSCRLQPTLGVAFVRRDMTTTDTFTRLSDQFTSQNSIDRHASEVEPMFSFEAYRRAGPLWLGGGYRFTQFKDEVLTQRLHAIFADLRWSPSVRR